MGSFTLFFTEIHFVRSEWFVLCVGLPRPFLAGLFLLLAAADITSKILQVGRGSEGGGRGAHQWSYTFLGRI